MINRVVLVGRMTRDPELRRTQNGTPVTSFTLALNRNFNSADGQTADYIPCVVWNKIAENVEHYCSKGSLVGVEGRLQSRTYDNSQGQKVFVVEVLCDSVQFIYTRKETEKTQYKEPIPPRRNEYSEAYLEKEFDNSDNFLAPEDDDIQF